MCKFCTSYTTKHHSQRNEGQMSMFEGWLEVIVWTKVASFPINFCPLCGEKLEYERVDVDTL